jgi:ElaB/YqjD/DUF883 family membrane-anchored ribosome-binding protein
MGKAEDLSVADTAKMTAASIGAEISATVDSASELARAVSRFTDTRVRERPWQTAAVAAGIGLLVGLVMRGRR